MSRRATGSRSSTMATPLRWPRSITHNCADSAAPTRATASARRPPSPTPSCDRISLAENPHLRDSPSISFSSRLAPLIVHVSSSSGSSQSQSHRTLHCVRAARKGSPTVAMVRDASQVLLSSVKLLIFAHVNFKSTPSNTFTVHSRSLATYREIRSGFSVFRFVRGWCDRERLEQTRKAH